ncbi:hypothetical protein FQA39_LY16429 [Lamprigera yunnana]|nr:hypothetical protein FQA39_LY16429 [Lamprigera yunnana]
MALLGLVETHKEVLECKKTYCISSNTKKVQWLEIIRVQFNAVCVTDRTAKMLRSKWETLKNTNKKEYAKFKPSFYKTGGGSPVINIPLNSIGNEVLAIIGIGALGRDTQFDSDFGIHFLYINIVNTPVYSCESLKILIYVTKCQILFIQKLWESAHLQLLLHLKILRSNKCQVVVGTRGIQLLKQPKSKVFQSSEVLEELDLLTAGLPIGVTILDLIGYVARVDGISMQPALNPDQSTTDYVFLNRWAVRSLNIKRGEIISLISPKDPDQTIIKRVVGIPGDLIATLGYKVHVVRVPIGHCWVEGDHTNHSIDSNHFGPVSLGLITAKASYIVWPPSRWQCLKSFLPESRLPLNILSQVMVTL